MARVTSLLILALAHADAAGCNGQSTPGPPNLNPIDETAPVLVKTVANGAHYTVGPDKVDMIHVFGKPYDWGYAHGTLMKEKLLEFFPKVLPASCRNRRLLSARRPDTTACLSFCRCRPTSRRKFSPRRRTAAWPLSSRKSGSTRRST